MNTKTGLFTENIASTIEASSLHEVGMRSADNNGAHEAKKEWEAERAEHEARLAEVRAKWKRLSDEASAALDAVRAAEKAASDAAPYECSVCRRGLWSEAEPHKHPNTFARKRRGEYPYYPAPVVLRKKAAGVGGDSATTRSRAASHTSK